MKIVPYSTQSIGLPDYFSVLLALSKDYLTQGPAILDFERAVNRYTNSNYCISCNSATNTLLITYKALGLSSNDILWTTPITFVATSNAALLLNAKVDFVDIEENDGLIDIEKLEKKLVIAKELDKLPKIITIVHLYGNVPDMMRIRQITNKYGVKIVEDASHALGSRYMSSRIGSCLYSDACVFSFHPVKIITTGEGGCATTNDKALAKKIRLLRSHGITKDRQDFVNGSYEPWVYEQQDLGYNFRLTDLQASLGISQLRRIEYFKDKRRELILEYLKLFNDLPLELVLESGRCESVYHLAVIKLTNSNQRNKIYYGLKKKSILCQVHYLPVHLQPYYQRFGFKKGDYPVAEDFSSRILSIPLFPNLKKRTLRSIVKSIREIIYSSFE